MSIPLRWLPEGGASNHQRLALMPAIARLASLGASTVTCRDHTTGKLFQFILTQQGWEEITNNLDITEVIFTQTGQPTSMVIDTLYRDGANYKNHDDQAITGTLTHTDLDTILTALLQDYEGIIPHQVGLNDHQGAGSWKLDFDNHDHPWHEVTDISFKEADIDGAVDLKHFLLLCEDRIKQRWDPIAALIHLQDKHA